MVRTYPRAWSAPVGFPRPRGDGPLGIFARHPEDVVPPPTRGWSRLPGLFYPSVEGSPAHAGMVPHQASILDPQERFPRPRGDGPARETASRSSFRVPPPTRGWSLPNTLLQVRKRGSPAHAGMVPALLLGAVSRGWFPRPRGDGPEIAAGMCSMLMVPPPTRGWSPDLVRSWMFDEGSPAHAGMVPQIAIEVRWWDRFPRPRGDGP